MNHLSQTRQFVRDVRRMWKREKELAKLKVVVERLARGESLDAKHRDHPLVGSWDSCRDCHIEPDWVLIYWTDADSLRLERTGSHGNLFRL